MNSAPRSPVWHPFTQHAVEPAPPHVVHTDGALLHLADGRVLTDAISSWWVVTHGHRHPPIMQAMADTAARLDQVIFAGLTHAPAEELAAALVDLAPPGLTRVFYSDSGSTAVEVGLKMALGFWHNTGRPRHRIAVLQDSYHGDTIGTMSVGERGVFNRAYAPLMFSVETLPFPQGDGQATLDAFAALARQGDLAAILLEPLVLGAGGMRMYAPAVLRELRAIAHAHGVLMIADEVMTGWGRTGRLWACDHAGIAPDILCTSKGITGGAVPLAATLATEAIFAAHYSPDRTKTFFHSSSYTANPIACAAALANARIWQGLSGAVAANSGHPAGAGDGAGQGMQARLDAVSAMQASAMTRVTGDARFSNLRQCGTIAAVDLKVPAAGYLAEAGPRLRAHFMQAGVLLRPLGNVIYVLPPYCITHAQLDAVWDAIANVPA